MSSETTSVVDLALAVAEEWSIADRARRETLQHDWPEMARRLDALTGAPWEEMSGEL